MCRLDPRRQRLLGVLHTRPPSPLVSPAHAVCVTVGACLCDTVPFCGASWPFSRPCACCPSSSSSSSSCRPCVPSALCAPAWRACGRRCCCCRRSHSRCRCHSRTTGCCCYSGSGSGSGSDCGGACPLPHRRPASATWTATATDLDALGTRGGPPSFIMAAKAMPPVVAARLAVAQAGLAGQAALFAPGRSVDELADAVRGPWDCASLAGCVADAGVVGHGASRGGCSQPTMPRLWRSAPSRACVGTRSVTSPSSCSCAFPSWHTCTGTRGAADADAGARVAGWCGALGRGRSGSVRRPRAQRLLLRRVLHQVHPLLRRPTP
jgi:hypothetical protein